MSRSSAVPGRTRAFASCSSSEGNFFGAAAPPEADISRTRIARTTDALFTIRLDGREWRFPAAREAWVYSPQRHRGHGGERRLTLCRLRALCGSVVNTPTCAYSNIT